MGGGDSVIGMVPVKDGKTQVGELFCRNEAGEGPPGYSGWPSSEANQRNKVDGKKGRGDNKAATVRSKRSRS